MQKKTYRPLLLKKLVEICLLACPLAWAEPRNLLQGVSCEAATVSGGGTMSVIPVGGKLFTEAIRGVCPEKKAKPWDVSLTQRLALELTKGHHLMLVFEARGKAGENGEGQAAATVIIQKASPNWASCFSREVKLARVWNRYVFPFKATENFSAGDGKIAFILGSQKQEVDVGGLALYDLGSGESDDLTAGPPSQAVPLVPGANMGFADETPGDGKGGWGDQGPARDMSRFDFNQTNFGGMLFNVANPARQGGKAILVFKSPHIHPGISLTEARLPSPGAKGSLLYLLHATAWCGPAGEKAGSVTVKLKSGEQKSFDVICQRDVGDWVGDKSIENGAVVGRHSYPTGQTAGLYLTAFRFSDFPEEVESIHLKTAGAAIWMVVGATLSCLEIETSDSPQKKAMAIKPHRPINLAPENPPPPLRVEQGQVTSCPPPTLVPVINPGKGWVLYGTVENQAPEVLALGSLGYQRYQWGDLEPEEGKCDWSKIDSALQGWSNAGKQFSFGVMNASTHSRSFWTVPKWVFDAGAKYSTVELGPNQIETSGIPGPKLVPAFDDPIFLEKLGNFLKALAARYDGHPSLAFIDIRSYGNWGESHMGGLEKPDISPEKYREHLKLHADAFKKTMLSVCCGREIYADIYPWCVSNGIGMRRDGVCGNSDGSDVLPCAGVLPAVFEFYGSYGFMKERGWWDGKKDGNGNGYRLADCVETGQATWCDLSRGGKGGLALLKAEPTLVAELANRLGYHIVLREARYPAAVKPGGAFSLNVKWENLGVAPMFISAVVYYSLVDSKGAVVAKCPANGSKSSDWKSGQLVESQDSVTFQGVPPGKYQLAVGLVRPGLSEPTIQIAMDTQMVGGWQVLGPLELRDPSQPAK